MGLRDRIGQQVVAIMGLKRNGLDFEQPVGDPGLYGPESVCWRVHSDFPSMLCGGISALMLQMLHPLALAGVWDHSDFRQDMTGRLQRTSQFIAVTSYAGREAAEAAITRVRHIHQRVRGTAPDGRSYSASDPALLTWVHVCEVYCFMQACLRYHRANLPLAVQDRYYAEVARIVLALGAEQVPVSVTEVKAYFRRMQAFLVHDSRTAEVMALLMRAPMVSGLARPVGMAMTVAAFDLLPDWAQSFYPEQPAPLQRQLATATVKAVAPGLRWSLRNGVSTRACRRMGVPPLWQRAWTESV